MKTNLYSRYIYFFSSRSSLCLLKKKILWVIKLCHCSYDANYDEDGKSNGGIIYHPMFVIPYVLMNGYKCVTVTDAVRMFVNCKPRCSIPKAVLQKHKSLSRTFCTWEQVKFGQLLLYL